MINILTKKWLILILFGLAGFGLGATPLSFLSPHFYLLLSLTGTYCVSFRQCKWKGHAHLTTLWIQNKWKQFVLKTSNLLIKEYYAQFSLYNLSLQQFLSFFLSFFISCHSHQSIKWRIWVYLEKVDQWSLTQTVWFAWSLH